MKSVQQLTAEYLQQTNVLQLATCVNNKPYVVNLHYYSDADDNIYWISTPERRHSQEIQQNPQACIVVKAHENTPEEPWVAGLTIEGSVEYLGEDPGDGVAAAYVAKLDKPAKLPEDILSGINPHKFYKLTPTHISLFDTKNFPKDPKQEWTKS